MVDPLAMELPGEGRCEVTWFAGTVSLGVLLDREAALDLGADCYMAQPYSPREILARIRSLTRPFAELKIEGRSVFTNIVVGYDGSACSEHALEYAMALAREHKAKLSVAHATNFAPAALMTGGTMQASPMPLLEVLEQDKVRMSSDIRKRGSAANMDIIVYDFDDIPSRGLLQLAQ